VAVVLGVLVAVAFGSGDFVGGRASMSTPTATVLVVSQWCAVVGAVVVTLAVGAHVSASDLVYGACAGGVNVVGLGLLYRGLASAAMGVVAPVTAVTASVLPVAWGLARGERPSVVVLLGAVLAIAAGGLIARESQPTGGRALASGTMLAVAAGAMLGTSLVLYAETSAGSGFWPVLTGRAAAAVLATAFVAVLASRRELAFPAGNARVLAVAAGVLDVTATVLLLEALRHGLLVVVAPVAALAPGFTVVLAWVVLREHLERHQWVGLLVALTGLVLVAVG
jgi:drug/metabolite transporter (DMT)-like permease